jgi:hypothetical protein
MSAGETIIQTGQRNHLCPNVITCEDTQQFEVIKDIVDKMDIRYGVHARVCITKDDPGYKKFYPWDFCHLHKIIIITVPLTVLTDNPCTLKRMFDEIHGIVFSYPDDGKVQLHVMGFINKQRVVVVTDVHFGSRISLYHIFKEDLSGKGEEGPNQGDQPNGKTE